MSKQSVTVPQENEKEGAATSGSGHGYSGESGNSENHDSYERFEFLDRKIEQMAEMLGSVMQRYKM